MLHRHWMPCARMKLILCSATSTCRASTVTGFREDDARRIEAARLQGEFIDIADLGERARLVARTQEQLADAGALRGLAGDRHPFPAGRGRSRRDAGDAGLPVPLVHPRRTTSLSIAAASGMAADLLITPGLSSLLGALFFLGYFFFQVPGAICAQDQRLVHPVE